MQYSRLTDAVFAESEVTKISLYPVESRDWPGVESQHLAASCGENTAP